MFILFDDHKIAISIIPKCACETIRRFFMLHYNIDPDDIKNNVWTDTIFACQTIDNIDNTFKKYLIVRNPYHRIISAYTSKIIYPPKIRLESINNISNYYNTDEISFTQFLNYLLNFGFENDPHFLPITDIINNHICDIIKIENIEILDNILTNQYNFKYKIKDSIIKYRPDGSMAYKTKVNTNICVADMSPIQIKELMIDNNTLPIYDNFLSNQTISYINSLYQADFIKFNYNKIYTI